MSTTTINAQADDVDEPEVCTGCGATFTDNDAIEQVGIPELRTLLFHSACLGRARKASIPVEVITLADASAPGGGRAGGEAMG